IIPDQRPAGNLAIERQDDQRLFLALELDRQDGRGRLGDDDTAATTTAARLEQRVDLSLGVDVAGVGLEVDLVLERGNVRWTGHILEGAVLVDLDIKVVQQHLAPPILSDIGSLRHWFSLCRVGSVAERATTEDLGLGPATTERSGNEVTLVRDGQGPLVAVGALEDERVEHRVDLALGVVTVVMDVRSRCPASTTPFGDWRDPEHTGNPVSHGGCPPSRAR